MQRGEAGKGSIKRLWSYAPRANTRHRTGVNQDGHVEISIVQGLWGHAPTRVPLRPAAVCSSQNKAACVLARQPVCSGRHRHRGQAPAGRVVATTGRRPSVMPSPSSRPCRPQPWGGWWRRRDAVRRRRRRCRDGGGTHTVLVIGDATCAMSLPQCLTTPEGRHRRRVGRPPPRPLPPSRPSCGGRGRRRRRGARHRRRRRHHCVITITRMLGAYASPASVRAVYACAPRAM